MESVAVKRSSTDLGVNVGAGFTYKLLFVEARYHYVFGPEFTRADGTTAKANSQFFPLTIGLRF